MYPRKVGSAWEIFSPAKLNLYLEVLGTRADGFHALETLMVPVRIYDHLTYTPSTGENFTLRTCSAFPTNRSADRLLGDDNDNLVLRAARHLARTANVSSPGRFDLIKRIPIQAGMGGGSSNAAAALLLVNAAWGLGYSRQQLMPLAAQLGSDVPFFLERGASICRGRGELVEPVARMPRLHFVIAKPPHGLSTVEVFRKLKGQTETREKLAASSRSRLAELIDLLRMGAVGNAGRWMTNRLESAAEELAPWLLRLREVFSRLGCAGHFMTGSGSAYVGVMRSAMQARRVAQHLSGMDIGNVFATSSC